VTLQCHRDRVCHLHQGLRVKVWGVKFGSWGFGFRGFWGLEVKDRGLKFGALGFRVLGLGCRVLGFDVGQRGGVRDGRGHECWHHHVERYGTCPHGGVRGFRSFVFSNLS
jgi:hypothetical protein